MSITHWLRRRCFASLAARSQTATRHNHAPLSNPSALVGLTGGEILHEMLLRHNVRHVFGYPGGAILPVFDAIYDSPHFRFILPRHEQGGGHMAEGYARVTGRPGVVLVTSGPGATNVITPMQDALMDGTPMVVFTGQVPTTVLGTDAFQEADVLGLSRSCTKWNVMVRHVSELPRRINEAFEISMAGRPGPVLVDLPKDVTASRLQSVPSLDPDIPAFRTKDAAKPLHEFNSVISQIARLIAKAERPVLYVGQGVLWSDGAVDALRELAIRANIPVTTTLQAMGAFDEMHPLSLHMLGMHGSAYANLAMQHSDLILAIGARFDDRVTGNLSRFAPEAHRAASEHRGGIVHVDIMPKNIAKVVEPTIGLASDAGEALRALLPMSSFKDRSPWLAQLDTWKKSYPFSYEVTQDPDQPIKPQELLDCLNDCLGEEMANNKVVITTGVGQHQMWAAQYLRWRHPHTFITSGGLGTMGYGLPAAIGAKIGNPDHIVIDIDGDASFSMTAMELQTAAAHQIGVKVLLLNNGVQGMVRQWQDLFYDQRYMATSMQNPKFVDLARSMHCQAIQIKKRSEMRDKLRQFIEAPGPVLLDCWVDGREHVYPMVPSGKALHEMTLGPDRAL